MPRRSIWPRHSSRRWTSTAASFVYGTDIFDPSEPHFGFWTFNNAFGMIDGGGYVVYNCTADAVTDSAGDANTIERLAEHGKAIVQTLHDDIRQR